MSEQNSLESQQPLNPPVPAGTPEEKLPLHPSVSLSSQSLKGRGKNRLTVVETIYHQNGGSPKSMTTRFLRQLSTDEEPYTRHCQIGSDWQKLDLGWFADTLAVGMLVLRNDEGSDLQTRPTEQVLASMLERVIEVGVVMPYGRMPGTPPSQSVALVAQVLPTPGQPSNNSETIRFFPIHPENIRLRCRKGTARACITLYPR